MKLRTLVVALGLLGPAALTQAQTQPQPLPDLLGRPVEVAPPPPAVSPAETRQKAMESLLAKAQTGDRDATYQLAEMMLEERTPQGHEAALELLSSLVSSGDAQALDKMDEVARSGQVMFQLSLAMHYLMRYANENEKGDAEKSIAYSQMAADLGSADGFTMLGMHYAQGSGVARDRSKAAGFMKEAAARGSVEAMRALGEILLLPDSGGSPREAVTWTRKAAVRGDMAAMYNLGQAYAKGQGIAADAVKARSWMLSASKRGHPKAQKYMARDSALKGDRGAAHGWMVLSNLYVGDRALEQEIRELGERLTFEEKKKSESIVAANKIDP